MIKQFTKYFSFFLIIFLINSNYSFAITHMFCKMSKMQNECECKTDSDTKGMQIDSKEPDCCKVKISEINNSNTLEKNKISFVNINSVQLVTYILPAICISNSYTKYNLYKDFNKPFSDIPILISSLLI